MFSLFFHFYLISGSVSYAARERDECNAQCALKRRSALFCFVFEEDGGFGGEEPLFPKAQNLFRRKRLRELVPQLLQEAPKRVNNILSDLQK